MDSCTTLLLHFTIGLQFPSSIALTTHTADFTDYTTDHTADCTDHTVYLSHGLPQPVRQVLSAFIALLVIATLRSHSVFSEVKSSLTLFIVCFICVLILAWFISSCLSAACPWIYCLFGLTLVLPFRTLFAPCLDYCSRFGLPLLSSPLDTGSHSLSMRTH